MKITVTVECKDDNEAHEVINLLTRRHKTWVEHQAESGSEIGTKDSDKKVDNDSKTSGHDSHPTTRPNVNPGTSLIGKIGTKTIEQITEDLKQQDRDPAIYGSGKWKEHLKLMWQRDLVKFDGKVFYI